MSPSGLPWWGWLLLGFGTFAVGYFLVVVTLGTIGLRIEGETAKQAMASDLFFIILRIAGWIFIVCGAGCLLISLVRFIKWVWSW